MSTPRLGACLLAVTLTIGACGGDDEPSTVTAPTTSSPTEATTSTTDAPITTTEDPTAAVEAAFYAQWDAFVEILSDPDPANPLIDRHFTGEARESLLDTISEFLLDGKRARLPEDPSHFLPRAISVEVDGEGAVLYECTVDGIAVVDAESGDVLNGDVSTYSLRNEFRLEGGHWKLASTREPVDGEPSCDG